MKTIVLIPLVLSMGLSCFAWQAPKPASVDLDRQSLMMERIQIQQEKNALQDQYLNELKDAKLRDRMTAVEKNYEGMASIGRFLILLLCSANGILMIVGGYIIREVRRAKNLQHQATDMAKSMQGVGESMVRFDKELQHIGNRLSTLEGRTEEICRKFAAASV